MPLFYFDVHDGSETLHDEYGDHWNSLQEAADHAASILPAMAADVIPKKKPDALASIVRDGRNRIVYRSILLFREDWPDRDRQPVSIDDGKFSCVISESQELMRSAKVLQQNIAKTVMDTLSRLERSRTERDLSRRAREYRARRAG